jgi:hypothetical protein
MRIKRAMTFRLAAEANRDPKTVQRVFDGGGNENSRAAVLAAARRIGIPESDPIVAFLLEPTQVPTTRPSLAAVR